MNKFALIFLVLTLVLGGLNLSQQQQTVALRKQVAALESTTTKVQAEAATATQQAEKLREQTTTQKAVIEQLETRNKTLATAAPGAGEGAPNPGGEAKGDAGDFMKGLAKMYSDPKTRDVMRSQQAAQVNMMYGSFAQDSGLAPEVARQVLALLGDRQADMAAKSMAAMARGERDPTATGKETAEVKQGYDGQLKAVLGEDGFKKLGEYEKTMGDRVALDMIQRQLSASGTKLEGTQQKGLLGIMKEERERTKVTSTMGNDAVAESKILSSDAATEQWLAGQQDMNRRVLDRARTVLNADQLVAFESAQKQFLDMQKVGVQMSKQFYKK